MLCNDEACKRPILGGDLKAGLKRVFNQTLDYTTSTQKVLTKYGSELVTAIDIKRTPLETTFVIKTLDLLKAKPYDDLFHLFMIVTLSNGKQIRIEKNQNINISTNLGTISDKTDTIKIYKTPSNKTLKELMQLTKNEMNRNYFTYDAFKNNCQDFLQNILKTNKMGRKETTAFIKQDVSGLVPSLAEKGLNIVSRIAGIADTFKD